MLWQYYIGDDAYFLALTVVFLLGLLAQSSVQRTYNKFAKVPSSAQQPAHMVAKNLLFHEGSAVQVAPVRGQLTDHYDPRSHVVSLSDAVFNSTSVAAIAVAAHEIGHVMQYEEGWEPIRVRNALLPAARIGSQIAPWIVVFGLMFGNATLAMLGVMLFAVMLLFQVATLPVEFNASKRALAMLETNGYLTYEEIPQARKVLNAAAMTYVVAALSSLVTLVRLLSITGKRRK